MATASTRAFRGNPYVTITSITPGTIASSRTSCAGVPAFFHLSASNVTASGTSQPYEDLEYRWSVTTGAEGYHTFALPWLTQIVSGTTQSTTKNSETDQVGPEAVIRRYTSAPCIVMLTIRGANGSGGYVTATTTIDLTTTDLPKANHFFYDPDAGNNANDGKDPWGFNITGGVLSGASITAGLYTIDSKTSNDVLVIDAGSGDLRTLTKTGAFTSYNHTTATAPTDPLARYNVIGITSGTAGSISTSNGPKASSSGTQVADDTVLHFKGGNTASHTLPTNGNLRSKDNCRFLGYGASKAYTSSRIYYNEASAGTGATNQCWHWWAMDGGGTSGIGQAIRHTSSGGNMTSDVYFSNITITGYNETDNVDWENTDGPVGFFNCTFSNLVGANCRIGVYIDATRWVSMVGCYIDGIGTNATLDHHAYINLWEGHGLVRWLETGVGTTRNYNLNMNAQSASAGNHVDYVNLSECKLTGTLRAWDASNHLGDYSEATDFGRFRNFLADGMIVHGLTGDAQVLFYCCDSMTIRDSLFYNNSGGTWIIPDQSQTGLDFKFYYNRLYCSMASSSRILQIPKTILPAPTIKNNTFHDTRTTNNIVLGVDFTNASKVAGNGLYTPNNAGNVATDMQGAGTAKTYAQYAAVDTTAQQTNPYWTDGSTGDFSIPVPTSLAATAGNSSLALSWANPTGAARNRLGYGVSAGAYATLDLAATTSHTLTGLAAGATYYTAVNQTDPYGWESAYCGEVSKAIPSPSSTTAQVLRVRTAAGIYTFGVG